jgi:hypothetical protein
MGVTRTSSVDDVAVQGATRYERAIVLPDTVELVQFRLAELDDPSGNIVTYAQSRSPVQDS